MVRREKTNYVIQSVAHALDVLEQFAGETEELGVTDLSKRLKLHKNNVFRLLATLESRGYIEQNKSTENYRLGIRCLALVQTVVQQMGLLRQSGGYVLQAEKMGHSEDVCTYVKSDIGMMAKGNIGPNGKRLPNPDVLLLSYTG